MQYCIILEGVSECCLTPNELLLLAILWREQVTLDEMTKINAVL
jgi:hypothetical protein